MTEKELKKLNRYQLLELLVMETERAEQLQKTIEQLEKELADREIRLSELGSIAEAAIQISGVLEASQQAADLYLEAAKKQADDIIVRAQRKVDDMFAQAEDKLRFISDFQSEIYDNDTEKWNIDELEK